MTNTDNLQPIDNHKTICRVLAPEGWSYGGFDNGLYHFQKGNYQTGFTEMNLLAEDLEAKNIAFMIKHHLTRIEGFEYD